MDKLFENENDCIETTLLKVRWVTFTNSSSFSSCSCCCCCCCCCPPPPPPPPPNLFSPSKTKAQNQCFSCDSVIGSYLRCRPRNSAAYSSGKRIHLDWIPPLSPTGTPRVISEFVLLSRFSTFRVVFNLLPKQCTKKANRRLNLHRKRLQYSREKRHALTLRFAELTRSAFSSPEIQ